jgi:hypothetical protein
MTETSNVFHQILMWKNAINASCARWAFTKAYFDLDWIDNIRLVERSESPWGYIAEFVKDGQVIWMADAVIVATWSKVSNSFWWSWAQDNFQEKYPKQSGDIKHLLLEGRGGIQRFGVDVISDDFRSGEKIYFDWTNKAQLEHYKSIQYIAADQVESDGFNWQQGEHGDTFYAYYLNDETEKERLAAYLDLTGELCYQVYHYRIRSLHPVLNSSLEESAELIAKYIKELLPTGPSERSSEAALVQGDLETIFNTAKFIKSHFFYYKVMQLHSGDQWEDPCNRVIHSLLTRLVSSLCANAGVDEESGLDRKTFVEEILPVMNSLVDDIKAAGSQRTE